jgi:hypothetical protein
MSDSGKGGPWPANISVETNSGLPFARWAPNTSSRMVKKLEWIEMAQLAVSSILFKSLSLKLP